jgi:uncharacterized protein (DUF1697 family)
VRYAAFLRAVNLGRNRRVSGAELKALFEAPRDMTSELEAHLEKALGHELAIFLRTEKQLTAMAAHEPFPARVVSSSKGKLQVLLLSSKPTAAKQKKVLALATDEDRLAFGERELYWLPSGGTLDSSLDQKAIGELLGQATMRTKGTIDQLASKFFS